MYDSKEIGKRIHTARISAKLKQSDVCKLLHIGQSTYSKIENGTYNNISLELIYKLAEIFNVSPIWLACFEKYNSELTAEEALDLENYKKFLLMKRHNKN